MTTQAPPAAGGFVPCGRRYGAGIEWLCVMTEFGQEKVAERAVRDLGLCTWLPKHFTGGRERPLFPAYLFAQADLAADPWQGIFRQPGVSTVVGTYRERPAIVPGAALAVLWADCAANGVIYPKADVPRAPLPPIPPGAEVTVATGAFAELRGICQRCAGDRVTILLRILGREARVTMPRSAVG